MIKQIKALVSRVKQELGKTVVTVRVFSNCLLLYFENGATRFYSKLGLNWGSIGKVYFVPETSKEVFSQRLIEQYAPLIEWHEAYYSTNNWLYKLWLILVYNTRLAGYAL